MLVVLETEDLRVAQIWSRLFRPGRLDLLLWCSGEALGAMEVQTKPALMWVATPSIETDKAVFWQLIANRLLRRLPEMKIRRLVASSDEACS
ncbi:hypothetical protein Bca52824_018134 [Brassica carinata]|uniref:Uncharacterized protein n=1 Tax=Brassica carinata TaxID=52824 RepID=A0A8X8AZ36_BRACI|nr:hypothetical protein Bca52824_018134 [Brassica carinata]